MSVKFGRDQIKNPSPAALVFWVRVWSVIGGSVITGLESAPFHIPYQSVMNWFLGLSVTIANLLVPMFGVQVTSKKVNTDDVTAMETGKSN